MDEKFKFWQKWFRVLQFLKNKKTIFIVIAIVLIMAIAFGIWNWQRKKTVPSEPRQILSYKDLSSEQKDCIAAATTPAIVAALSGETPVRGVVITEDTILETVSADPIINCIEQYSPGGFIEERTEIQ